MELEDHSDPEMWSLAPQNMSFTETRKFSLVKTQKSSWFLTFTHTAIFLTLPSRNIWHKINSHLPLPPFLTQSPSNGQQASGVWLLPHGLSYFIPCCPSPPMLPSMWTVPPGLFLTCDSHGSHFFTSFRSLPNYLFREAFFSPSI